MERYRLLPLLLYIVLTATGLRAQEGPPVLAPLPPPPLANGAEERPAIAPTPPPPGLIEALAKARSGPDSERLRDPFWPIGWVPPEFGDNDAQAHRQVGGLRRWQDALRLIEIVGLSKKIDGTYIAMVKGIGVVEEGDVVSVDYEDFTYKWHVRKITSKGIVPERLGATPLK